MAQSVIEVISGAERAIVALASESALQGGYDRATALLELARSLKRLANEAEQSLTNNFSSLPDAPAVKSVSHALAPEFQTQISVTKGRRKKTEYPRFLREGESLVKIGWSRKDKAEYEHKCPKDVLGRLALALTKAGSGGKRFSMEAVFPHASRDDGSEAPVYQLYLALAWFRAIGLVVQHGRQGYSLATKTSLEPILNKHWDALPSR